MIEIRKKDAFYRNFIVQGQPKGKARPRATRQGHMYNPPENKVYEKQVADSYLEKYAGEPMATGCIHIEICVTMTIPKSATKKHREELLKAPPLKKPDLDNVAKIIMDGLNRVAYEDDVQITALTVYRTWGDEPQVEVWILGG